MPRMILLGVGTAVPDSDRENPHMVWEATGGLLLIDAGGSTYQRLLRAGLDPLALRGIFLTHSHADHLNGLPALLFQLKLMGFSGPLPIYGNQPTLDRAAQIIAAFDLEEYQVGVEWVSLSGGQEVPLSGVPYRLHVADTIHSRPCLALRFEHNGRALVYSADTEPCEAVLELAQQADILIHEATTAEPFPGHTTPRQAGEVAAAAGVGRLILVHFSPRFTMSAADAIEQVHAGGFQGDVEIGREYGIYTI
ncbi:MAG TPA: MBL fold metallo-hydrolase [Roseiflexaceae bacterium]|nr:MBL fold metallo-hydrolase [Roseiflexaceae bacterium]